MLRQLKFPLVYLLEVALMPLLMAAFFGVVSFLAAEPVAQLDLGGKSLPAHWDAAYFNHGEYLRGFIITQHPAAFAMAVLLFAGLGTLTVLLRKAQAAQAAEAGDPRAHKIARTLSFIAFGAMAFACMYGLQALSVAPV